jgi:hypothetical protein
MPLDPLGHCPVHALGGAAGRVEEEAAPASWPGDGPPALRFPWGVVEVGAERLRLGRAPDDGPLAAYVTDQAYGNVSRCHAELWSEDGCLYVRDVGSTNGTYVNESRIGARTPHRLRAGDVVRFAADLRATVLGPPSRP